MLGQQESANPCYIQTADFSHMITQQNKAIMGNFLLRNLTTIESVVLSFFFFKSKQDDFLNFIKWKQGKEQYCLVKLHTQNMAFIDLAFVRSILLFTLS